MLQFIRDALTTLVAVVLVMLTLPKPPEYNNNIGYKHHYITHHASDVKTLIIGHSHFENGLNPHLLGDSTFNLASAGCSYYYDLEILREYLPQLPNVKTVLFPIRYCLSDKDLFKTRFCQLFEDYYYGWNLMPPPEYRDTFKKPFTLIPHYTRYKMNRLTSDTLGYVPEHYSPHAITLVDENYWIQSDSQKAIQNLAEMASICAENHVRFIVLACPHSNLFLSGATKEGLERVDSVVYAAAGVNRPIEYRNYMADSQFRSDSLYRDWSHLTHRGATLFAQRIKEDFGL